jgi:flagellar biogenesis protein FliO
MQLVQRARATEQQKISVDPQGLAGWLIESFRRWRGLCEVQGKQMRLVETLSLGGKRELMLVSCAGERFLVGVGPEGVETMVRLKAEAASDAVAGLDETCQ